MMPGDGYPTADDMRKALVNRAAQFCDLTKMAPSTVGRRAVNDSNFFKQVEEGRNITLGSYEQAMRWFDENWPAEARK